MDYSVPNVFHFCFGMTPDYGGKPFSLVHYLSIVSAYRVNAPERMVLYYAYEPDGRWWREALEYVEPVKISPPVEIFGNPLCHPAHQADVVRLEVLKREGGIYMDLDVICLRPMDELRRFPMVMGHEFEAGLCNAVIIAAPQNEFICQWWDSYHSFRGRGRDHYWNEHSVEIPGELARRMPHTLQRLDHTRFFWPMWWDDHLELFFNGIEPIGFTDDSYCVHLWEQCSWDAYLKELSPEQLLDSNSEFSRLVRPYIESLTMQS